MSFFDIDNRIIEASQKAMELCKSKLDEINDIQEYNQQKMIKAFQEAGVREVIFRVQQAMAMTISAEMLSTVCMPMLLTPRTHL